MTQALELYNPQPTPKASTLYNWLQEFYRYGMPNCMPRSIEHTRRLLDEFEIFVNNRPITRELVLEYITHIEKKQLGHWRYNKYVGSARRFLKWCERQGFIEESPGKYLVGKRVPKQAKQPIITEDEYEKIKEATKGTKYYYFTVLGYRTGMLLVDCCYLRWENVDFDTLMIENVRVKMRYRCPACVYKVPIIAGSDLHEMLLDMRKNHVVQYGNENDNYVNPYLAGYYTVYSCQQFTEYFSALFKRLGMKGKTFKHFRVTFVSHLANVETNVALACHMTGHTDPKTFLGYVQSDPAALRSALMKAFERAENLNRKKV